MGAPAVEIRHLSKEFPSGLRRLKVRALDSISLTVPENTIFGLLGPNGCGKSTTIKSILGLLQPSAGTCRVLGTSPSARATRAGIGYLPEAPDFYRFMSGRELVRFYARMCGLSGATLAARVDAVLDQVGLAEAAARRVGTYSKGMLQRVGLAQAIVHDPKLVILDEPTAGVDPVGAAAIAAIIRQLKADGKTVLLASHLLSQVEALCDEVVILNRGRVACAGPLATLITDSGREWLEVDRLSSAVRAELEAFLSARGLRLHDAQSARRSLDAVFQASLCGELKRGSGTEERT